MEVNSSPIDESAVRATLAEFIRLFIRKDKRSRAEIFLLDPTKRREGLRHAWSWLDASKTDQLSGSAGFPQHLEERFGGMKGVFIGQVEAVVVSAPEAAGLGQDASVFVFLDSGQALIFHEIGPPDLCVS